MLLGTYYKLGRRGDQVTAAAAAAFRQDDLWDEAHVLSGWRESHTKAEECGGVADA